MAQRRHKRPNYSLRSRVTLMYLVVHDLTGCPGKQHYSPIYQPHVSPSPTPDQKWHVDMPLLEPRFSATRLNRYASAHHKPLYNGSAMECNTRLEAYLFTSNRTNQ